MSRLLAWRPFPLGQLIPPKLSLMLPVQPRDFERHDRITEVTMSRGELSPGIDRRTLVTSLALLPTLSAALLPVVVQAQTASSNAPLASWNDGPAKQAIIDFVRTATERASPKFVAPEDRIATFDQDGTLWVEHPIYSQVIYCLDRVPAVVEKDPKLKNVEPFKTVLSGNREAIAKLPLRDLEKILVATLTGMSVDDFETDAKKWLAAAKDHRWKRPYTELI